MLKKWSIIIVNYKSHIYLKWQFKILYEFNDPAIFDLIIIDNSVSESEKKELDNVVSYYKDSYDNINLIYYIPQHKAASGQHGEAIEVAKKYINTRYTLIHDPDFFWLKPNYLNWMEKILLNNDAFGAPYPRPVAVGHKYFPSAFGCAYVTEKIKDISFAAYLDGDIEKSWQIFYDSNYCKEGYDFYYDVGWRVREELSKDNDNFITLSQNNIKNGLIKILNLQDSHSFQTLTTLYSWNSDVVAIHLFRGTFTGKVNSHCDPKLEISNMQYIVRDKIGELMYKEIGNGCPSLNKLNNEPVERLQIATLLELAILEFLLFLKRVKIIKCLIPFSASYIKNKINKLI